MRLTRLLGFDDVTAICNCCGCSCYALRIAEMFRLQNGVSSNFVARVDKEKCVACGQCVENCQTNAIRLGQKNCTTNPHISDAYDTDHAIPWDKKATTLTTAPTRADVMESGTAPLQGDMSRAYPRTGLHKARLAGQIYRSARTHQEREPLPRRLRPHLQQGLRGRMHESIVDSSIAIDDIKKFIAEKDLDAEHRYVPKMLNLTGRPYTEKIAVIGAGPAGMSCAYYLALKGYPVTVFEKEQALGGMLTLGIPSFRLDKAVVNAEIDILKELGVEFRTGVEVGKDVTLDSRCAEGYKAFYLGIGASKGTSRLHGRRAARRLHRH